MDNIYYPYQATVTEIIDETPTIKTYCLEFDKPFSFKGGQFMQLTVPGVGEAPFTPSSAPGENLNYMEISILKAGRVTDYLHSEIEEGDTLGLRGPFGEGYPFEKFEGKDILIVGGGVGLAPLRACLYGLFQMVDEINSISIKYGARTPDELLFRRQFEEWRQKDDVNMRVTIDKEHPDWDGHVGLVTTILEEEEIDIDMENSYVMSCGPQIMLKFVTFKLLEVGFDPKQIYLSMNRRMSCGVGKCHRCNIGPYYLCKDGPDMCYDDIKDYPNVFS